MKNVYSYLVLLIIVMIFLNGCAKVTNDDNSDISNIRDNIPSMNNATEAPLSNNVSEVEMDYSDYFNGIEGTAVFYSKNDNTYYIYNKKLAEKRSSPCSSFKIISSLMGLEGGAINPEDSVQKWNGTIYSLKEWNKDINYIDAFRVSCIWYFRKIIDLLGAEYVQIVLDQLDYGNRDISEWEGSMRNMIFPEQQDLSELNGFWQESSLQISPIEQVDVQRKIFEDKVVFNQINLDLVKNAMYIENSIPDIKIYGKTGSGIKDDTWNDGWFVGMFEMNDNTFYFAVRLNQPGKRGNDVKAIAIDIINNAFK